MGDHVGIPVAELFCLPLFLTLSIFRKERQKSYFYSFHCWRGWVELFYAGGGSLDVDSKIFCIVWLLTGARVNTEKRVNWHNVSCGIGSDFRWFGYRCRLGIS